MLESINFTEIGSVFIVLFAVIDIIGAIPIIIDLRHKNRKIEPKKTVLISSIILITFLYVGDLLLSFLTVDIQSFAVAGAIILLLLAMEMIFGFQFFKDDSPGGNTSTLVPLVFPLIAGAASFTTLLSFRAQYELVNIIIATLLNMGVVFFVLSKLDWVERLFGQGGIYVLRKFFGVILMAMAVKLFTENISALLASF
ncbi:MAG: MarC family protein [Porphyromonas sp.]|nr:MarC family protein [Porphyromonas sp.]